jgi:predicted ATPase
LSRRLGDDPRSLAALWALWIFYHVRAELPKALDISTQCIAVAERVQSPALLAGAHAAKGSTLIHLGTLTKASEHIMQAKDFAASDDLQTYSHLHIINPAVGCDCQSALLKWLLGFPDSAVRLVKDAVEATSGVADDPQTKALALLYAAWIHQLRGEPHETRVHVDAILALSHKHGIDQLRLWGSVLRGWAIAEQGAVHEGILQMRRGLRLQLAAGSQIARTYFLALLSDSLSKCGRPQEAFAVLSEAIAFAVDERTSERFFEADLHRARGELILATHGEPDRAVDCFWQSFEMARRQSARSLELRAVISLNRLPSAQRPKRAPEMLRETFSFFIEGAATEDLKNAAVMLKKMFPS